MATKGNPTRSFEFRCPQCGSNKFYSCDMTNPNRLQRRCDGRRHLCKFQWWSDEDWKYFVDITSVGTKYESAEEYQAVFHAWANPSQGAKRD